MALRFGSSRGHALGSSLCLAFALFVLCAGCGEGDSSWSGGDFDRTRAELERDKRFQLYYLGSSFDGFALSRVLHDGDPWRTVSFIYGDCEPPVDGGCAPPLEVQVDPACKRGRGQGRAPVERFQIRGVPAAGFSREVEERVEGKDRTADDQDGMLEVYTGWETITIYGGGQRRMRRAAGALRPLSSERVSRTLPPPARAARRGRITCQEQEAAHAA